MGDMARERASAQVKDEGEGRQKKRVERER